MIPEIAKGRHTGKEDHEVRLWHTYAFRAWRMAQQLGDSTTDEVLICEDEGNRIGGRDEDALMLVLFAASMLEHRMKRVLATECGCQPSELEKPSMDLGHLLGTKKYPESLFWKRLAEKAIKKPDAWESLWPDLDALRDWRNRIAHGNWAQLAEVMDLPDFYERACRLYNSAIEVVALINEKTGNKLQGCSRQECLKLQVRFRKQAKGETDGARSPSS